MKRTIIGLALLIGGIVGLYPEGINYEYNITKTIYFDDPIAIRRGIYDNTFRYKISSKAPVKIPISRPISGFAMLGGTVLILSEYKKD